MNVSIALKGTHFLFLLAVMTERKCGSRISHFWQLKQSVSGKAELQIFVSQGRAEVRKRNLTSSEVTAVMKCGSSPGRRSAEAELEIFRSPGRTEVWKAEFHIFSNQGRAEMWKQSFRPLEVLAEQKCGS